MDQDRGLEAICGACKARFPGRIRALYVLGSYAEGTPVPLSDLDLLLILRGTPVPAEAEALAGELAAACPARVDLIVRGEAELGGLHAVLQQSLRSGSRLVCGEDLRQELPPVAHAAFARAAWDGALHFSLRLLRGVTAAAHPLGCPDPSDAFCGYATPRIAEWYPPGTTGGTKELVATASRLATAMVATLSDRRHGGKSEAFRLFPAVVGGPWAGFVRRIFEQCKLGWHYAVPADPAERDELSALCRQMTDFENYALEVYGGFWRGQHESDDPAARAYAEARRGRIVFGGND